MTPLRRSLGLLLPALLAVEITPATEARAQGAADMQAFRENCMMDYFEFCAGLSPNGPEVRACFRQNRANLSSGCADAISSYERRQAVRARGGGDD